MSGDIPQGLLLQNNLPILTGSTEIYLNVVFSLGIPPQITVQIKLVLSADPTDQPTVWGLGTKHMSSAAS